MVGRTNKRIGVASVDIGRDLEVFGAEEKLAPLQDKLILSSEAIKDTTKNGDE